jgi:hypothetical protein
MAIGITGHFKVMTFVFGRLLQCLEADAVMMPRERREANVSQRDRKPHHFD